MKKIHYEGSLNYVACGRTAAGALTTRRPSEVTCRRCYPLATGNWFPATVGTHFAGKPVKEAK